ncbi:MAG: MoaD/ThiS family protein [Deltaproteobacteria bacterium]|nr:MoaD/ThiS family protein [Deltaproteobacteria bacterium]
MAQQITVTLRCFSHVKHLLGQELLSLELPHGSRAADLEREIRARLGPSLARMVFRLAVNQQFVEKETPLSDGDEVALIPPMQGG